jgi:hypothetical protein
MDLLKNKNDSKLFFSFAIIIGILTLVKIKQDNDVRKSVQFRNFLQQKSQKEGQKKACVIILVRNSDLKRLIVTIENFEKNFNHRYNYPYVLFNNEKFTTNFKVNVLQHTNSLVKFAKISPQYWNVPNRIDKNNLQKRIKQFGTYQGYMVILVYFFLSYSKKHK